ncbi:hypothetical protein IEO21_02415 [Rhodonia placenta]|uniref:Uncharacterized protein n=1 Tax=Rhodonia placenta TaxID=104341 RepID=A0A8H7P7Z7_9APHY|nr:hypothetical protein IEO21_02415 [Postia placenta]
MQRRPPVDSHRARRGGTRIGPTLQGTRRAPQRIDVPPKREVWCAQQIESKYEYAQARAPAVQPRVRYAAVICAAEPTRYEEQGSARDAMRCFVNFNF